MSNWHYRRRRVALVGADEPYIVGGVSVWMLLAIVAIIALAIKR